MELTGETQCETFTLKDMLLTYRPVRTVLIKTLKKIKIDISREQNLPALFSFVLLSSKQITLPMSFHYIYIF